MLFKCSIAFDMGMKNQASTSESDLTIDLSP